MWKKYELNIKCRRKGCGKTYRKMTFEMTDKGPAFLCQGCQNYYVHPALNIIFEAGIAEGRKDLQRELRCLLGSASYDDAVKSAEKQSQLEFDIEKLEAKIP